VTIGANSDAALVMVAVSPDDTSHGNVQYRAGEVPRHASCRPPRRRASCSDTGFGKGEFRKCRWPYPIDGVMISSSD
jgi:hypothetical protein